MTKEKLFERVGSLKSARDVARYQAKCIKLASRGGGVLVNDCYKLVMMSSMLVKTLEVSELEERITILERNIKGKP